MSGVVACTNQDLREKIEQGDFREDLYYRLNVVEICVSTLRERKEDIPCLVDHFVKKFNKNINKEYFRYIYGRPEKCLWIIHGLVM